METLHPCPKCNEPMDEGSISLSGSTSMGYMSKKQTGMIRVATKINLARACTNCGYLELYVDPKELKSKVA